MDIFRKNRLLTTIVYLLVLSNVLSLSILAWNLSFAHSPLLFPKNEAYKDVSGILKKELNLSEKQVDQFDEIRRRNLKKQTILKKTIRDDKDAMNQEMFNKNTDALKIHVLALRISENEYKMESLRWQQAQELKAVCTSKQLDKFQDLVIEIRDYFRPDNQPTKR
jgi:Spy/CpxP family protein refolding chaperone